MATARKPKSKSAVAAARRKQKQPPWLWIGVGVLVLALAAAAIISSGGDDDSSGTAAGVVETRSVSVTGAALPQFPREGGADPGVGKEMPDVTGQSFDGTPVSMTKDGKPKLILFVAHWCPHCQKEVPLLADYLKDNPLQGVDLYTVSTSVQKNQPNYPPSEWLDEEGWTAPTLADSEDSNLADAFGLSSFPYFVAVDASGKVVARTSGELTTEQFAALADRARG
ncbi:MAG TPA: TlpA disulfide reductase family protein [Acidimicrobiia bacterium]|nr:TlpA disulfide reductase family protein [Acidimicrobiia bacterium]